MVLPSCVTVGVSSAGAPTINLDVPHMGLDDTAVPRLLEMLEGAASSLPDSLPASVAVSLVFEMNYFTSAAVSTLLARLLQWQRTPSPPSLQALYVKRFRFHMNRIDDSGGAALAAYVRACISPGHLPAELHLSHNRLSVRGAVPLLAAAAAGAYPRPVGASGASVPLWLRLEHNRIDVAELKRGAAAAGLRWCGAEGGGGGGRGGGARGGRGGHGGRGRGGGGGFKCGAALCLRNGPQSPAAHRVHMHLPFLSEQRPPAEVEAVGAAAGGGGGGGGGGARVVRLAALAPARAARAPDTPVVTAAAAVAPSSLNASSAAPSLFIVLDTSAVIHMTAAGFSAGLTFHSLFGEPGEGSAEFSAAPSPPPGDAVFVLLDTVLQQLDKCKETPALRGIVGRFMRLYPALEASGALIRLLSEDVEDAVRCGGANVATQPGCRLPDGKFDSDGVILDGALVVMRAVGPGGAALALLTDDQYQLNRARGVGLPAAMWKEAAARWGRGRRAFSAAAAAAALGAGGVGDAAAPAAAAAAAPAPAASADGRFRLPHKELLEAARTVRSLCDLLVARGGGGEVAIVAAAREKADVWEAMHAEKVSASSLHSALYAAKRGGSGGGGGGGGGGSPRAAPAPSAPPLPPLAVQGVRPALPVHAVVGGGGGLNRRQRRALQRAAEADGEDGEVGGGGREDEGEVVVDNVPVREVDEEVEALAEMLRAVHWREEEEEQKDR
jgi:hypothetical protein